MATQIGALSEDVKLYMRLPTAQRYSALNDRTINLFIKGQVDMSATTSETAEVITNSDKDIEDLIKMEQEVELFIVDKDKTRAGGAFFDINLHEFDYNKPNFLNSDGFVSLANISQKEHLLK